MKSYNHQPQVSESELDWDLINVNLEEYPFEEEGLPNDMPIMDADEFFGEEGV